MVHNDCLHAALVIKWTWGYIFCLWNNLTEILKFHLKLDQIEYRSVLLVLFLKRWDQVFNLFPNVCISFLKPASVCLVFLVSVPPMVRPSSFFCRSVWAWNQGLICLFSPYTLALLRCSTWAISTARFPRYCISLELLARCLLPSILDPTI